MAFELSTQEKVCPKAMTVEYLLKNILVNKGLQDIESNIHSLEIDGLQFQERETCGVPLEKRTHYTLLGRSEQELSWGYG